MTEGPADKLTAHIAQNYQITEEIGRDAMSRLFQATSPSLGSAVIIQVIPGKLAPDPDFADRFQARMRKAASFGHRNILHVNHFAHEEPNYYVVLDYFDGRPLDKILGERGPLLESEAVHFLTQALDGLDHAHKNGMAHGALHAGGILLADDGEVRLTGFGIAKAIDPHSMLVETPDDPYPYKSPEQDMGLPADARSDLYSLGLIAWQALTGKLPQGEEISPPSTVNAQVSAQLEEVIMRMLVPRPRDRFRTARQVAIAMSGAARAGGRRHRPVSVAAPQPRPTAASRAAPDAQGPQAPPAAQQPAPEAPAFAQESGVQAVATSGIDAYNKGNIEDAVRLLEEAAEPMPRSVRVLTYLGAAYYAAARYADAADAFSQALEIRADLSTLRCNLGNALLAQGKTAEAKKEFERAWAEDPRCTSALLALVSLEGAASSR